MATAVTLVGHFPGIWDVLEKLEGGQLAGVLIVATCATAWVVVAAVGSICRTVRHWRSATTQSRLIDQLISCGASLDEIQAALRITNAARPGRGCAQDHALGTVKIVASSASAASTSSSNRGSLKSAGINCSR